MAYQPCLVASLILCSSCWMKLARFSPDLLLVVSWVAVQTEQWARGWMELGPLLLLRCCFAFQGQLLSRDLKLHLQSSGCPLLQTSPGIEPVCSGYFGSSSVSLGLDRSSQHILRAAFQAVIRLLDFHISFCPRTFWGVMPGIKTGAPFIPA